MTLIEGSELPSDRTSAAARASTAPGALVSLDSAEGLCLAICHDLRGPVAAAGAAVAGLASELAATAASTARSRYLEIARRSLAKADELLGALPGMLERGARPATQAVPLDLVVARVRDDVDLDLRLAGARLLVRGALPVVRADPHRLRIALRNLVQNAIRHPRRGVALEIRIRAWRRESSCTLTVSDNGAGLATPTPGVQAPAVAAAAARRARAAPAGGGLGIGLAIARQAIEACGGAIVAASKPGCGTSFAITLPSASAAVAAPGEASLAAASTSAASTARGSGSDGTRPRADRSGSGPATRASPAASRSRHRGAAPPRGR